MTKDNMSVRKPVEEKHVEIASEPPATPTVPTQPTSVWSGVDVITGKIKQ